MYYVGWFIFFFSGAAFFHEELLTSQRRPESSAGWIDVRRTQDLCAGRTDSWVLLRIWSDSAQADSLHNGQILGAGILSSFGRRHISIAFRVVDVLVPRRGPPRSMVVLRPL